MAIFLVRKDSKICVIFMKHCRNYGGDVCTHSKTAPSLTDKQAADKDRSRPLTLEALGNIVPFLQGLIVSKSLPFDFLPVFLWYCENGKFVKNKNKETKTPYSTKSKLQRECSSLYSTLQQNEKHG